MRELVHALGQHGLALAWQTTILIGVVWLLSSMLGERWASLRYGLWLLVLARLALPIVLTSPFGLLTVPTATPDARQGIPPAWETARDVAAPAMSAATHTSARPAETARRTGAATSSGLLLVTGWSWLLAMAVCALISLYRHHTLRRLLRGSPHARGAITDFIEQQRTALGLRAPVGCRVKPAGVPWSGPALVGLWRPLIVVPRRWVETWDVRRHGPLIVHELVHLARRDPWVNLLTAWVRVLYCLHPLAWLATARLVRERERVCDDAVVAHLEGAGSSYLRALCHHGLSLADTRDRTVALPVVALTRTKRDLIQRIRRLAHPDHRPTLRHGWVLALPLVGLVLVATTASHTSAASPLLPGETAERSAHGWYQPIADLEQELLEIDLTCDDLAALAQPALALITRYPTMSIDEAEFLTTLLQSARDETQATGRAIWQHHLDAHPDHPAVLRNAAVAFEPVDPRRALALSSRSIALAPTFRAVRWLAEAHRRMAERPGEADRPVQLTSARARLAQALELAPGPTERLPVLAAAAQVELATGALGRAEVFAHALLDRAAELRGRSSQGNALHAARLILGEVALVRGDLDAATRWLQTAADVPASPQLRSFGPNTRLAEQLLARGHREPVLRYLSAASTFWTRDPDRLERWTADIRAGRMPDFGSSRHYHL